MKLLVWFSVPWYQYLFSKPFNLTKLWCRIRGHPMGQIYYNPAGLEPDYRCRNCLDEI